MDAEEIDYIIRYYRHLMTDDETQAQRYWQLGYLDDNSNERKERDKERMIKAGWLSERKDVLALLGNGIEHFEKKVAYRIVAEETVFFNRCDKCKMLARTPKAKQCRYCDYDWH